jgi:hypothetical protein
MSSSATTATAARSASAAPAVPLRAEPHQSATQVDEVDRSYGRAIAVGSIVGILAFTAAMWIAVRLLAPEWPAGAVTGIAAWCGIWSGVFLGGTVAVGRWSMRQGH